MTELLRALAVLAEPPTSETALLASALGLGTIPTPGEYTDLFVFQLYPYASVYLGVEGMLGGEARDRIAGFWRALGQTPPMEADHLALMLAMYARLCELEELEGGTMQRESRRHARKVFLWEHLLSWLPAYLSKLSELATPFYLRWGEMLMSAMLAEASTVGAPLTLSSHLLDAPGIVDPREGDGGEFVSSLLSTVRSGMILTRADLGRAARSLSLGLRAGERLFVLKSLLGQDAAGTLDWLAREAESWTARHAAHLETLSETARAWEHQAAATAGLLRELKLSATEVA